MNKRMRKVCKRICKESYRYNGTDHLAERAKLAARLRENVRPDGRVLISESGRDCDGVSYTGHRHYIAPHPVAYDNLYRETSEWADGPFSFYIEPPESEPEQTSRDLTLEAFEDGHPHIIYG